MKQGLDTDALPKICSAIGNDVASDEGFVSIRDLVSRFDATLYLRPLLVEGMLASLDDREGPQPSKWAVLIDSETYAISDADIANERHGRPLHDRFRNSVAHELVHLLAFRPEFLDPGRSPKPALLKRIEQEVEKLSPLLLWPEKALSRLLDQRTHALTIQDLIDIRLKMGISRQVLINRLDLLPSSDDHRFRLSKGLQNIGIGVGEWIDDKTAAMRSWPVFLNYERNNAPAFLARLKHKETTISASEVFRDTSFGMCGGWSDRVELETEGGVIGALSVHKMRVAVSMEWVERRAGNSFFFLVTKL